MQTGESGLRARPESGEKMEPDDPRARSQVAARHISRKMADANRNARERIKALVEKQKGEQE
ncbi:MAG TPA: hypothetical protein VGN26_24140 [Armatimonadota bacterium]|jgi:hypothetical protein